MDTLHFAFTIINQKTIKKVASHASTLLLIDYL